MGHWGTAILSNDTSADIKATFLDLYDNEGEITLIRKKLESEFKDGDDLENNTDFWLTLALLQWQIGHLENYVKAIAEQIISSELDLKVWKAKDADDKTIAKRKAELSKLFERIQTLNPKPRKRKKKKMPTPLFKKGEVFAFPLINGNFSALIILEEILNVDYHYTLAINIDIKKAEMPSIEDVLKSNILVLPPNQFDNVKFRPLITCYLAIKYKDIIKTFTKIGEINIDKDFLENFIQYGASSWSNMVEIANLYLVENKEKPDVKLELKKFLGINTTHSDKQQSGATNWFGKIFGR